MKKCNVCGSDLLDSFNACPNCGNTNLIDNTMIPPSAVAATPAEAAQPAQVAMVMPQEPIQPISNQSMIQPNSQPMIQPENHTMNQSIEQSVPSPVYSQPIQRPDNAQLGIVEGNQDKGNILYAVLGFFIPIVGLIMFFVLKKNKPADAKLAGIGCLIGYVFALGYFFLF